MLPAQRKLFRELCEAEAQEIPGRLRRLHGIECRVTVEDLTNRLLEHEEAIFTAFMNECEDHDEETFKACALFHVRLQARACETDLVPVPPEIREEIDARAELIREARTLEAREERAVAERRRELGIPAPKVAKIVLDEDADDKLPRS